MIADFIEAVVEVFRTFLALLRRPEPDESGLNGVGRLVGLPVFGALALLALAVLVASFFP